MACPSQGPQRPKWAWPCFSLRLTVSLQRAVSIWVHERDRRGWKPSVGELRIHFSAVSLYHLFLLLLHKSVQHASWSRLGAVFHWAAPPSSSGSIYFYSFMDGEGRNHISWALLLGRCSLFKCFPCYYCLRPTEVKATSRTTWQIRSSFLSPWGWASHLQSWELGVDTVNNIPCGIGPNVAKFINFLKSEVFSYNGKFISKKTHLSFQKCISSVES